MRIWSIQESRAWREMQKYGILRGKVRRLDRFNRDAYKWISGQMVKRGFASKNHPPIWAWISPKPDLRESAHLERGKRGVRLELEIDPIRVLASDFDAWHCVLNRWYLALSWREDSVFERKCRQSTGKKLPSWKDLHSGLKTAIRHSWERIFDIERLTKSCLWNKKGGERFLQCVLREIRLSDVVRVTPFTAR